ncbi:MAG TPA: hypothetical protein DEF41_10585 [Desulfovibrio sp.]|uniref:Uncharacterized protein n=1 Tax=Nitratidesulfovibrio vulgaris (strain ATCC 29579 / DSM 644 / CCUG 34227 / NCIMB 8303 / VKM B-1760 / Hildenborough) TaxID=882 RepID=Q72CW2_NITV2|nr:hypothetical protein DVU_1171 [Nitratidesulfovibrio vulgaris str. Hildenborough]HBW16550.1 hypothetical protein [Desulfovibrio sp.]
MVEKVDDMLTLNRSLVQEMFHRVPLCAWHAP